MYIFKQFKIHKISPTRVVSLLKILPSFSLCPRWHLGARRSLFILIVLESVPWPSDIILCWGTYSPLQWVTFVLTESTAEMSSLVLNWLSALPCLAYGLCCHLTFLYSNSKVSSLALDSWLASMTFSRNKYRNSYIFSNCMGKYGVLEAILPNNSWLFLSSCRHPCWLRSADALWDGLLVCSK